jgi:hypothetical protein
MSCRGSVQEERAPSGGVRFGAPSARWVHGDGCLAAPTDPPRQPAMDAYGQGLWLSFGAGPGLSNGFTVRQPDHRPPPGQRPGQEQGPRRVRAPRCRPPIGVASWETELVRQLPEDLRSSLPTVEELEEELEGEE